VARADLDDPTRALAPHDRVGGAGVEARDYPALRPLFTAAEPAFRGVLAAIEDHAPDLLRIAAPGRTAS
jgi:hypothetical protein